MNKKSEKDLLMMISELHKKIAEIDKKTNIKIDKSDGNIKGLCGNVSKLVECLEINRADIKKIFMCIAELHNCLSISRSRDIIKEIYNIYIPNKLIENNILYLIKAVDMDKKIDGKSLHQIINDKDIMLNTIFIYINEKKECIKKTPRDFEEK